MAKQNIIGALREQSDWEQQNENRLGFIKNKPFYDARKTEEIRIPMMVGETLEGAVSGYSYKLSDITPSLEELNSAVIETKEGILPISTIGEFSEKILIENKAYILENDDFGLTMAVLVEPGNTASLSKGIYVKTLTDYEAYFVITRTTGELKTIDPKFLPSGSVGYTENTKKTLLPEQTFEPKEIHEGAGLYVFDIDPPFSPVVGDKFTVNWNGTRYVCETVSKMQDGYLMLGFGNQGLLNDDGGTDEPFMYSEMEGDTGMFITLGTEPVTVSVIVERETIHTIDPKFLPSGGGGVEKTILFDGTPTKLDLSSVGFGYAYLCSQDDLVSLVKGQDVHYEFTANGIVYSGVIDGIGYQSALAVPYLISLEGKTVGANIGYPFLIYAPTMGGTGFQLSYNVGLDIGEVTNLKLWTEYNENKLYFITGYYNGSTTVFLPTDQSKVIKGVRAFNLAVRYVDAGGNMSYLTPTDSSTSGASDYESHVYVLLHTIDSATVKNIRIENGQVTVL